MIKMRYQQKQRRINKTARQRFEMQNETYKSRSHRCLRDNVERFRAEHIKFIGRNDGRFNQELDWTGFLKDQDSHFAAAMSQQRSRGSAICHQSKDLQQWQHMMNTFKNVVKSTNQTGANNKYIIARLLLSNISVVY